MKKIIHLSDLHVGAPKGKYKISFAEVVDRLCKKIVDPGDHVLVITGDLVDDAADPQNYLQVKQQLDRLKKKGFKDILVIPGNHDYKNGDRADEKFIDAFKRCFYAKDVEYPKKDIIDEIAFMGLDSMAEELHGYDSGGGEGHVGERQRKRLWKLLDSEEIKSCAKRVVYLHHHPLDAIPFLMLKDSNKLMEGLAGRVDAILYGHHHLGKNFNKPEYDIPRCYDAGCVTRKEGGWLHSLPALKVRDATRVIQLDQGPSQDVYLELSRS